MRTPLLLIVALIVASAPVVAQPPRFDGSRLRTTNDTFYTLVVSADRVDTMGWATQSLTRFRTGGSQAWAQVYRWHGRDGSESLDSLVMSMDLLPLTEARTTDVGSVEVAYSGPRVRASIQPTAGVARKLDTTFVAIVYASASIDAIARVLPSTGRARSLAFYYPFPAPFGVRPGLLEPSGVATIKGPNGDDIPCRVVIARTGGGVTTFWIAKATGKVVQFDDKEGDTVFRFRRPGAPAS